MLESLIADMHTHPEVEVFALSREEYRAVRADLLNAMVWVFCSDGPTLGRPLIIMGRRVVPVDVL